MGGPGTNAAITFAHLGGEAILVTGVGQHALTAVIRDELRKYTVDLVDLTPNFEDIPVVSAVAVNQAGQRNIISANSTRISVHSAQVRTELLRSASILLVDGHYMQACQAWARAARECGIRVVLDGGSWKAGTDELLRYVDTAICSADFKPPGCTGEDQVIEFLKSNGVHDIAITAGSAPIRFVSEGEYGVIPVLQVPVVDTMGAGDILLLLRNSGA